METPRDDVTLFEYPVLDALVEEVSREYIKMLGRMNEGIADVLKHARGGVAKSEGLYVIPGGLTGTPEQSDLLKAAKPKPKPGANPRKKMSEAEAKRKKAEGVKQPGSRGGKWWRDKHGHVRYGHKPTDDEGERDWEVLDEEEVKKLHTNLEAVYGYHHSIRAELNRVLDAKSGLNADMLMQVFRDANSYGLDASEYWIDLAADSGVSEKDAKEAFAQVQEAFKSALEDPDFRRSARQAIQKRQLEEQHAGSQVKRSEKYSDGKMQSLMSGNAKEEAIRLLGLMSDMELLHIPHTTREAQESFETKQTAQRAIGSVTPNKARLQAMYSRMDDMNGAQLLATYVAQMFRDMREGGYGFAGKESAESYFQDGKGAYETDWLPEGDPELDPTKRLVQASEIERANISLNENMLGALGGEKISEKEQQKAAARIRELAHEVYKYVEAFNSDQGGQELGLIFTNQISPESLFKDKNALKELTEKVAEKQKLVKDAMEAQGNIEFKTPAGMVEGFKKENKDLLDYQRQALNWMTTIKRGILAYDTGMGKTPMSIAMVAHMHDLVKQGKMKKEDARGIMVMPLGLVKQWPNEIKKFFPDAKVVTIGDDIEGVEDRVKVLEAIQQGKLDADFVILSSSVVNFHNDTREAFKSSELFEMDEKTGELRKKKGVSDDEVIASMRDSASGDKLCAALRQLKGCVFFDEAHHEQQGLKNPLNIRNAAAREFLKDREHSFLLTATPMPNGKPPELFELMDLIHPGSAGPDVKKFENKMSEWQTNPETGERELVAADDWGKMARDIAPYVFRKSKLDKDVVDANKKAGMELPRLIGDEGEEGGATHALVAPPILKQLWEGAGTFKPHDFDERAKKAARKGEKPKEWKSTDDLTEFGKKLRIMHQQQMLSVTPKLILGDGTTPESQALWKKHGYNGEEPKLEHLAGLVKKHFSDSNNRDSPIVIFSQWPGAFEHAKARLKAEGIDESLIGEIHGGVDVDQRNAVQEACNAGKLKVVFVGTQAGGAGLNLQKKARKMVFLDQPWMIAHKQQALGRVWRTGQKHDVEVINLYVKGTFDMKKLEGLANKSATDVAVSSAHLDEETLTSRGRNMMLSVLGGAEGVAATQKIEAMSDSELQARIDAKGLRNLVTPKDLKQKFDIKPFAQSVEFKNQLDFGQQAIQTKRMLTNLKHQLGELSDDEHKGALRRLARAEEQWAAQSKLLGREGVSVSAGVEPTQPTQTFALVDGAKGVKMNKLSPVAQHIVVAMKKNGGAYTMEDYLSDHLKEEVDKQVKRDKNGQPEDPMQHISAVRAVYDQHDEHEKTVKTAFRELEKVGLINAKGTRTPKASETPLPKMKVTGGEKHKPTSVIDPEGSIAKVNFSGGWSWKFKGDHTSKKEYKKAECDLGGKAYISLKDLVEGISSDRKKPKDLASFQEFLSDIAGRNVTEAATRKIIKQLHEHGVMT